jgi:hypothetical protein
VYAAFRILLAAGILGHHGLNVWAFTIVEILSSVPWALGSVRLATAVIDRHPARAWRWGTLAVGGFLAPDLFVVITTHHVPWIVYLVIGFWVLIAGGISARRLALEIKLRRRAGAATRTPPPSSPSPH